ncbi:MAG: HAD-IIIA family hydrolase [Algisphaera sp.]
MKRPAVFLDRDNTIIHNDGDLGDPDQVKLIQGVPLAIASLCGLGYRVVVVTNQGGVARGKYTEADVEAVHERIVELVCDQANGARIEAFYACPFHPEGTVKQYTREHETRKPKPGMLLQATEDLDLDLEQSWMVGDQLRDVAAGAAAGCRTILLRKPGASLEDLSPQGAKKPRKRGKKAATPDEVVPTLVEAVRIIAVKRKPEAKVLPAPAVRSRSTKKRTSQKAEPVKANAVSPAKPSDQPFVPWTEAKPGVKSGVRSGVRSGVKSAAAAVADVPQGEAAAAGGTDSDSGASQAPLFQGKSDVKPDAKSEAKSDVKPDTRSDTEVSVGTNVKTPSKATAKVVDSSVGEQAAVAAGLSVASIASPVSPAAETPGVAGSVESVESTVEPSGSGATPTDVARNVRLILKELRVQRGSSDEVPQLNMVALALQALTGLCLLGALWMGAGDDAFYTFFRWITVTIVLQVAVVATLQFGKR